MPKPSDNETHRSFTVRVPLPMYLDIATLAKDEGTNLNKKVTQLLLLGLGKHISLDAALRQLLVAQMTEEPSE